MALPATDTFTGSNGDHLDVYSANWTLPLGAIEIFNNTAAADSGGNSIAFWNADAFDDDQYAEVTVASLVSSSRYIGPAVRCSNGSGNGYGFISSGSGGSKYLSKIVAGSRTDLASSGSNLPTATDVMRIEASGTTITPKVNATTDAELGAQTDASLSSGSGGLMAAGDRTDCQVDDFEADDLGGAPPAALPTLLAMLGVG